MEYSSRTVTLCSSEQIISTVLYSRWFILGDLDMLIGSSTSEGEVPPFVLPVARGSFSECKPPTAFGRQQEGCSVGDAQTRWVVCTVGRLHYHSRLPNYPKRSNFKLQNLNNEVILTFERPNISIYVISCFSPYDSVERSKRSWFFKFYDA